ncbi:MarR family winged helix-turn-helix transcriptional regulator [Larkinella insperata]|uniref:MarR family winged helix-turn-helix transcriptional regulator n=1 Tax=Larkinella insperata TaxID=332158 RepID=A0ABW3Q6N0_9BACT|nr:MarR family transcriptional regulator [Larkinella insperata]
MKSRPFRNSYHELLVNLHSTQSQISNEFQKKLEPFDLSSQQYFILRLLSEAHPHPLTVSELKNQMVDRSSDITRLIDRLVKKSLVIRENDPENRRKVNLRLSEDSYAFAQKVIGQFQNFESIVSHLSEPEVQTLNELLNKIRNQ